MEESETLRTPPDLSVQTSEKGAVMERSASSMSPSTTETPTVASFEGSDIGGLRDRPARESSEKRSSAKVNGQRVKSSQQGLQVEQVSESTIRPRLRHLQFRLRLAKPNPFDHRINFCSEVRRPRPAIENADPAGTLLPTTSSAVRYDIASALRCVSSFRERKMGTEDLVCK